MERMRVWIDQDCCTGAGLCVDHCPDLFIVLEDGIGYVHDGVRSSPTPLNRASPCRAVTSRRRSMPWSVVQESASTWNRTCPRHPSDESDIVEAELVDG